MSEIETGAGLQDTSSARVTKAPDVRRIELLTAAMELFTQFGYKKTSVQMITEKVGVAKGLFYHYFDSKADLLQQLATWQADTFFETLPTHASEMEGDALHKTREIISKVVQWKFEDARGMTLAYLQVMYREENAAFRMALVNEYTDRIIPIFTEIIAEGVAEGLCDVDDPQLSAEMIFATWTGAADRLAALMLALPQNEPGVEPILARVRAWEGAIERILGIEAGTLQLYDYEYLARAMTDLAALPPPGANQGASGGTEDFGSETKGEVR